MDFLVNQNDLHECRVVNAPAPVLEAGQARLDVSAFGLTSNNVTYAVFGKAMRYWDFFPAEDGWGRIPVWGFADVAASTNGALEEGARVFGYLPPSTSLVVTPDRVDARGFVDASPHRAGLPSAYNGYVRVDADPSYRAEREAEQMLLRPLFFTSFLIDDFLADSAFFGARSVVLSSASSKTAHGTAFLLSRREGIEVIGLTSPRRASFVEGLGVYDRVVAYGDLATLPRGSAVYLDVAGDSDTRAAVHEHYGERLAHSSVIGATHHDRMGDVPEGLPGPRPTFFFAPDRVAKRSGDWGRDGLESRMSEAWRPYVEWTGHWLQVTRSEALRAAPAPYLDLLEGRSDPAVGHVLSLT